MSAPALLIAGSLTIDNVRTAAGDLLPRRPGGNVVFAALGARLWSHSIGLVSRAGTDYPADALEDLAARGIDLGGITRTGTPHGMNVAFSYAPDGSRVRIFPPETMAAIPAAERARFTDYGAAGSQARFATWLAFSPDASDIPPAWLGRVRAAHCAAMPVQSHLSLAAALAPTRVQVDSPWYDERAPATDFHTKLLAGIAMLLPSEADCLVWRPQTPPLDTAAALARQASRPVLVKRGSEGAVLLGTHGQPMMTWPAFPVSVVDPTGAGDAFCGGFLAGLDTFADIAQAGACGTVAASFAVGGEGTDGLRRADPAEVARRRTWVLNNMERDCKQ